MGYAAPKPLRISITPTMPIFIADWDVLLDFNPEKWGPRRYKAKTKGTGS